MDWADYKALCDQPLVMSRWMLGETAALLPEHLRGPLEAAMAGEPLPKPADHKGGAATDMFHVRFEHAGEVLAAVCAAAADGAKTSLGRPLGGFVAAWREVRDAMADV